MIKIGSNTENPLFVGFAKKEFEKEGKKMKVRDHCHYNGKYRGAAHVDCNLKFKNQLLPLCFFTI